jgi:hypothetical protein
METIKTYENYPIRIVILSSLVSFLIYLMGFLITFKIGLVFSIVYLSYIFALELRLIKNHCTACYYWGKTCGFGKGRISSAFFKKRDISDFCSNKLTWKDMIPDLLVTLIPLIAGIVLLIIKFEPFLLFALILLLALTTAGNQFIRGSLTCKFCKQREIGCPAEKLFNNGKK